MTSSYFIELNAKLVKEYRSLNRAKKQYQVYASNPNNLVRIWFNGDVVLENTTEED